MATDHKHIIRQRVWPKLNEVACPDSRFHYDSSSFIAEFEGLDDAVEVLTRQPCCVNANLLFVTPDNYLEKLRRRALEDGERVSVTNYATRRGFYVLDPQIFDTDAKAFPVVPC